MNYNLIITCQQLRQLCEQARKCNAIALDTEFIRTRTYYPQLGVIQLYDGERLSLIDPLSIIDWQPFIELLTDRGVTKFFHAASEDLEVFLYNFQTVPTPMLDTQILVAFTGYPLSCGFATIVKTLFQVELDKSGARTDWLARPLSAQQCHYAAADVFYLLPLGHQLVEQVTQAGWIAAATEECEMLCRRRQEVVDPLQAYRDINHAWQLRPNQLACLQLLAEWRLKQARERDIAVNFIVAAESLWKVARYLPCSLAELNTLGIGFAEIRYHGKTLLAIVAQSSAMAPPQWPLPLMRLVDQAGYKQIFKMIKTLVAQVAQQHGLAAELIASRRQINQFIRWYWKQTQDLPEMRLGWREKLFAEGLNQLLAERPEVSEKSLS